MFLHGNTKAIQIFIIVESFCYALASRTTIRSYNTIQNYNHNRVAHRKNIFAVAILFLEFGEISEKFIFLVLTMRPLTRSRISDPALWNAVTALRRNVRRKIISTR